MDSRKTFKGRFILYLGMLLVISPLVSAQAQSDWKEGWEKILAAGHREGEVTVYGQARKNIYEAIHEFKKAYPKIRLNFVGGQGSQLGPRVMAEKRAGKHLVDLAIGGAATQVGVYYKAELLEPLNPALILPEVRDESRWWGGKHLYADPEGRHVFMFQGEASSGIGAYNANLVKAGEIQSWWDLLNPKWKGKIVMTDPKSPGNLQSWVYLYYTPELGPKFIRRLLSEMDIVFSADERQMVDWLAQGKYPIHLLSKGENVERAREQGLPVADLDSQKEAGRLSSGSGHLSLFKNAPHPNAAKVYINWLLSREGQIAWQRQGGSNSLRMDIPKDMLPLAQVPREGERYFISSHHLQDVRPIRKLVDEVLAEAKRR